MGDVVDDADESAQEWPMIARVNRIAVEQWCNVLDELTGLIIGKGKSWPAHTISVTRSKILRARRAQGGASEHGAKRRVTRATNAG